MKVIVAGCLLVFIFLFAVPSHGQPPQINFQCINIDEVKDKNTEERKECREVGEKAGGDHKTMIKAAIKCYLEKIGILSAGSDNINYDQFQKLVAEGAKPGKADVLKAAIEKCKDKATTIQEWPQLGNCLHDELKSECPEIEQIKAAMQQG